MICTNRDAMELARTAPATLAVLGWVQIRLSHEVGVISDAQYHSLAQALTETGRMIGGWKKSGEDKKRIVLSFVAVLPDSRPAHLTEMTLVILFNGMIQTMKSSQGANHGRFFKIPGADSFNRVSVPDVGCGSFGLRG